MSEELVAMPASPRDLLRVNRFLPFEEGGRRLMYVVSNAAFCEADDPTWALAGAVVGRDRVTRSEILGDLAKRFGDAEASEAVFSFEQLEIFEPFERSRAPADGQALPLEPLSSLVLHVSHDCNMRCGYCYADFGRYGGDFGYMDPDLAVAHTARFFDQLGDTRKIQMTFFGGEPLMNMAVVRAAHAYAKERAAREGRRIAFGLTTNGTLLTKELAAYFDGEGFSITVSIDGPPDVNDRLRPLQDGRNSYDAILAAVRESGIRSPHARVTLTRRCLDVARIVRHLLDAGFADVGVSPVASGSDRFDLDGADLETLLAGLAVLADEFVDRARRGEVYPFSNIRTVLEQISTGDVRSVPCGAGTRLAAADNKGALYACHRLVGQPEFEMGHVTTGIDDRKRLRILTDMHPRTREPCQSCWARYLCGGGCHHIAWLHSDRKAAPWHLGDHFCDFLRGWYRLALYTYARMIEEAPEVLATLKGPRSACSQPQGQ